jgi:hypothetical protein
MPDTPSSEAGSWRGMSLNLADIISLSYCAGFFVTCPKILGHGADGITFPSKQGVLPIFIAFKNTSPSAGFQPANLGPNDKHDNYYTTEDKLIKDTLIY